VRLLAVKPLLPMVLRQTKAGLAQPARKRARRSSAAAPLTIGEPDRPKSQYREFTLVG